jgi:superoxide reductase
MAREIAGERDLLVGVNEPFDARNLSDLEKKHIPVIDAPDAVDEGRCFRVEVGVGQKGFPHPNDSNHFIQHIDLYADAAWIARVQMNPARSRLPMVFTVSLHRGVSELRAYAACNLHGVWVGRRSIVVT